MPLPARARAAISLTYDDALPVHRELVAPELARRGLHGTFYAPAASTELHDHRDAWHAIAADGHELGNHTCFHPCRKRPGGVWPDDAYDLRTYSAKRFIDELALADRVLRSIDGRTVRSFAATCGNLTVGPDGAEIDVTQESLGYASCIRSGHQPGPLPLSAPPKVLPSLGVDGKTAELAIEAIDRTLATGGWLIILAHGVGQGTHGLFIAVEEHRRIIDHLAGLGDAVWGAPVAEVYAALA